MSDKHEHEPFLSSMNGGNPFEIIDEEGLFGKKGKTYYECYMCHTIYVPETKKGVRWRKGKNRGEIARGDEYWDKPKKEDLEDE